ncbi:MAG: hypothetical protein KDJ39_06135 [Gammaproteobacteria bacterium]|nr:hypothetical protein [Gammaproteobacteria bacterium]
MTNEVERLVMCEYPNLDALLRLMGADNDMPMKQPGNFTWPSGWDLHGLDRDVAGMTEEEREIFACGELGEMEAIRKNKHLESLDEFLNSAFQGDLHEVFYHT